MMSASDRRLPLPCRSGPDEASRTRVCTRPARIPSSVRRPNPPQARLAVPTLIPPDGGTRRRGQVRWLAWPAPKVRLPAEHAGLRLPLDPAARYDEARRPSSRLDRTVCDPSGGGSDTSLARVRKAGKKSGRNWDKVLGLLGVGRDFVHVFGTARVASRRPPFSVREKVARRESGGTDEGGPQWVDPHPSASLTPSPGGRREEPRERR